MSETNEDTRDTKEARKVLLAQAAAMKLEVDGRWSVETLAEKVLEAQESRKDAEKAEFAAAATVWIYLLRDGFPIEDEKHRAGETILITPELAERWYEAGVARPSKAPEA